MAILLRLRQAFLRSSSIPKNCSFPPIASDSSRLINLLKTLFPASFRLENPSIRPTPSSNHDLETKTQKDKEIDFVKFPKPSPEEMIQTCFQTLAKVMGSMEDAKGIQEISDRFKKSGLEMIEQLKCACTREKRSVEYSKVIQEMSDKLKKSGLEMIEQLKDMLRFVLVSPDLDIVCKDTKFEGENEVITPRLPSPLTEYENQLSVEDMEMINEMSEKLTKYTEVLEKLKAMHGFTSHSRDFYIDCKKKKSEDYIEKEKTARIRRKSCLSKEMLARGDMLLRFKDYIEMTEERHVAKESLLNIFSPAEISMFAADMEILKVIHGPTWKMAVFNFDEFEGEIGGDEGTDRFDTFTYPVYSGAVFNFHDFEGIARFDINTYPIKEEDATKRNTYGLAEC